MEATKVYQIQRTDTKSWSKGSICQEGWRGERYYDVKWISDQYRAKRWNSLALVKKHLNKAALCGVNMDKWKVVEVIATCIELEPIQEWITKETTLKILSGKKQ